jgi:predicted Fe-Mo cluster-binding NifX family protein
MEDIHFAFAVSNSNTFETSHFGDADKYLVFAWNGLEIEYKCEVINDYKSFDEEREHGSKEKGNAIIELLQKNDIQVLVSKQFGRNIKMVNRYFIPVIIDKETPEAALAILNKHIGWIEDELRNSRDKYSLFTIRKGILKTVINKAN